MIPRDLVWCIEELAAFGADAKVLTALLGTSSADAETTTTTTGGGGEVEERIGRTLALVSVRETCEEMVGRRGEAWVPMMIDEDEDEDAERCVSAFETVADVLSGISKKENSAGDGAGAGGFCIDTKGENYEAFAAAVGEATLVIENMFDVTSAESFAIKCGVAERRGPMNKRKKEPPAFRMKALAIAIDGLVREMFTSSKTPTSLSLVQKSAADARRPNGLIEPMPKPTTIEQTTIEPKLAVPKAKKKKTETIDPVARGWNDVGQRPAVAPKPVKRTKEADETTKTKPTEAPKPKPSKRTRDAEETMLTPVKQMKTTEPAAKPVDGVVSPTRRLLGNVVSAVSRTLSWASRRKSVDGVGTPVKLGKENDLSEAPSEDEEEEDIMPTQVACAPPSEEDEEEEPEEMEEAPEPEEEREEDAKMTQVDEELETPTATQRTDELPTQPVRVVHYDVAEEIADDDIEDVEPPLPSSPPGGSIVRIRAETPLPTPLPIAPRQPPEPKLRRRKIRWEPDEVIALEAGVARFGVGSWAHIHQAYSHTFERHNRSQVDLKDKWRNLEKARAKSRAI